MKLIRKVVAIQSVTSVDLTLKVRLMVGSVVTRYSVASGKYGDGSAMQLYGEMFFCPMGL